MLCVFYQVSSANFVQISDLYTKFSVPTSRRDEGNQVSSIVFSKFAIRNPKFEMSYLSGIEYPASAGEAARASTFLDFLGGRTIILHADL